ncbi:F-BAR domain only protein 1-like [Arapaima gigas]
MALFKNNFWGEKNAGFDVLYHNMKHGQLATKELAEFVRERAAIEETYAKSMSKLAKMASNGSSLGTFAPMWDLFRVSADKLALCHLELTRKMNDLIRDVNKYGDEQVKVHRKMKEGAVGTVEAMQTLQAHSGQLHKTRENHLAKRADVERLRREGAPQKELEKAEAKLKKAAASLSSCVEKYNRVAGDFELRMSDSAQRFQDIEEAHLWQMKQLIKSYSHSVEDTHVQLGQVHEEFKQNVENIGAENLIQKFTEQKGTGKDRPTLVGLEDCGSNPAPEGGKKSRGRSFRIPGLGKKDREPDSRDSTRPVLLCSLTVGSACRLTRCPQEREESFYSSDSDFDDDEPKKFHIHIRPVGSNVRCNSAANERELRATVGTLTLPPNRGGLLCLSCMSFAGVTSCTAAACLEGVRDGATDRGGSPFSPLISEGSASSSRMNCTASGTEMLFGPPLETTFVDTAFSSQSSSPENVEDSGLDSPSHQPLGPSPEPNTWAAWPVTLRNKYITGPERALEPLQLVCSSSVWTEPVGVRVGAPCSPSRPSGRNPAVFSFAAFAQRPRDLEPEPTPWAYVHVPVENPFPSPPLRSASLERPPPEAPRAPSSADSSSESHGEGQAASGGCLQKQDKDVSGGVPALGSPKDPFSGAVISSPTRRSCWSSGSPTSSVSSSVSSSQLRRDPGRWSSVRSPFGEGVPPGGPRGAGWRPWASDGGPHRSALPLARHSGPQEELRLAADKEQSCTRRSKQNDCGSSAVGFYSAAVAHNSPSQMLSSTLQLHRLCLSVSSTCRAVRPPALLPPPAGPSRGPSPISPSGHKSWPVAAAITEYVSAFFPGGGGSRCLLKITGDFTMSFPAGITCVFAANPNISVLSFRLVNLARVENIVPNQKVLCSGPPQSAPATLDFWFDMQALGHHLQREAELNPQASYHNVGLVKYQVTSQDPGHAPLLLCGECQRSGTVTRVSLDYRWCLAAAPEAQVTSTQVLLPLDHTASDVQCQPPAAWNAEERRLLWKLPDFSSGGPTRGSSHSPGRLCASWQSADRAQGPPPSLAVQFVGTGGSLSGLDVELVGNQYRLSVVKKRFATGKQHNTYSLKMLFSKTPGSYPLVQQLIFTVS